MSASGEGRGSLSVAIVKVDLDLVFQLFVVDSRRLSE